MDDERKCLEKLGWEGVEGNNEVIEGVYKGRRVTARVVEDGIRAGIEEDVVMIRYDEDFLVYKCESGWDNLKKSNS